jgi:hypothetical protein
MPVRATAPPNACHQPSASPRIAQASSAAARGCRSRPTETERTVDEIRISSAGDAFYAAASPREEDTIEAQYAGLERLEERRPHGCYEGWVYMGFEDEGEQGERVELVELVPCRRCRLKAPLLRHFPTTEPTP